MKDEHTYCEKMARNGRNMVIYKGTFVSNQSLGYLDGYLLHRTCVFKALRLFFLSNFPGPMFIPCPMSIPEARVVKLEPT